MGNHDSYSDRYPSSTDPRSVVANAALLHRQPPPPNVQQVKVRGTPSRLVLRPPYLTSRALRTCANPPACNRTR